MSIEQTTQRCADIAALMLTITLLIMGESCRAADQSPSGDGMEHANRMVTAVDATVPPDATVRVDAAAISDAGDAVAPSELAAIEAWWTANFYADSDIQHSFDTASGSHIDCIDFAAQYSVRAMVAHGESVTPPPPPPGIIPQAATTANIPSYPAGNDGTLDANGNVRSCQSGRRLVTLRPKPDRTQLEPIELTT